MAAKWFALAVTLSSHIHYLSSNPNFPFPQSLGYDAFASIATACIYAANDEASVSRQRKIAESHSNTKKRSFRYANSRSDRTDTPIQEALRSESPFFGALPKPHWIEMMEPSHYLRIFCRAATEGFFRTFRVPTFLPDVLPKWSLR